MNTFRFASLIALPIVLTACQTVSKPQSENMIGMPNPASVYCIEQGGTLLPKKDKDGNEYALCQLPTGQVIEEWDLFRKDHPQP